MCTTLGTNAVSADASAAIPKANAIRGPLNALFFTALDGYINRLAAEWKSRLFADLPTTVVELGAGVGANFRYIKKGSTVIAVEPNPHMHGGLQKRAQACGITLDLLSCGAEAIDLPDDSVDAVICTLVLCTVDDPVQVLREVRRILKPGGRFYFLEHVAAEEGSWRYRLQTILHRPWRYLFEGCNTNRKTGDYLRHAGFANVDLEAFKMRGPFIPVNTQIAGIATA